MSSQQKDFFQLSQWISESIALSNSSSYSTILNDGKLDRSKPLSRRVLKELYKTAQHTIDQMCALEQRMKAHTLSEYTYEAIKLQYITLLNLQILALDQKNSLAYISISSSLKKLKIFEKI